MQNKLYLQASYVIRRLFALIFKKYKTIAASFTKGPNKQTSVQILIDSFNDACYTLTTANTCGYHTISFTQPFHVI